VPQAERDDWLFQLTQELLDAARNRVNLVFSQSKWKFKKNLQKFVQTDSVMRLKGASFCAGLKINQTITA
jgi:hypothetical protein